MSNKVYEIITERILTELEKGAVPWKKPWKTSFPKNLVSGKEYRGINLLVLMCQDFGSPYYLTFKQAKKLGGAVRKGAKSIPVVYWNWVPVKDRRNQDDELAVAAEGTPEKAKRKMVPILRYYRVFNLDQCEGIEPPEEDKPAVEINPIEECERIVAGMPGPPVISHKSLRACYRPATDTVSLPPVDRFISAEEYYSTCFHELAHSTGHASRLNRPGVVGVSRFGSEQYSQEEMVAEVSSAFLCGIAGIENRTIENSAAYIQNWLKVLKNDKRMIVIAAAQSQKAVDYILGKGGNHDHSN